MSVEIGGNTYPVRSELKALGGKWDGSKKVWVVPDSASEKAKTLVASAPKPAKKELTKTDIIAIAVRKRGGTPGVCFSCGAQCKYPYDECWGYKEERDMGY